MEADYSRSNSVVFVYTTLPELQRRLTRIFHILLKMLRVSFRDFQCGLLIGFLKRNLNTITDK